MCVGERWPSLSDADKGSTKVALGLLHITGYATTHKVRRVHGITHSGVLKQQACLVNSVTSAIVSHLNLGSCHVLTPVALWMKYTWPWGVVRCSKGDGNREHEVSGSKRSRGSTRELTISVRQLQVLVEGVPAHVHLLPSNRASAMLAVSGDHNGGHGALTAPILLGRLCCLWGVPLIPTVPWGQAAGELLLGSSPLCAGKAAGAPRAVRTPPISIGGWCDSAG